MTLKCKDTKLWPIFGCITMFLPWKTKLTSSAHFGLAIIDNKICVIFGGKWMFFCCVHVFDLNSLTPKTIWSVIVFTLVWPNLTLQHDAIGLSLENNSISTFILTSNYAHMNMKQNGRGRKMINHPCSITRDYIH